MGATYMIRKHLRSQELSRSPSAVADRVVSAEACKRAAAERKALFPVITPENFEAAEDYQKERGDYWRGIILGTTETPLGERYRRLLIGALYSELIGYDVFRDAPETTEAEAIRIIFDWYQAEAGG